MEKHISVEVFDIKGISVCTKLLVDIIKFVLGQRRQIPFPYDYLRSLATSNSLCSKTEDMSLQMFKEAQRKEKIREVYQSFEEIFEVIESQLQNGGPNHVQEIALIFGTTINCPKEIYLLKLTCGDWIFARDETQYKVNKYMRDVALNEELQTFFDRPLAPNNIHVLMKLPVGKGGESVFPREDYEIPLLAPCVTIVLNECSVEYWRENCHETSTPVQHESVFVHHSAQACRLTSAPDFIASQAASTSRISSHTIVRESISKSDAIQSLGPLCGTHIPSCAEEHCMNLKAIKCWWCQVGKSIQAFKYKCK